jgi:hypothetical protein
MKYFLYLISSAVLIFSCESPKQKVSEPSVSTSSEEVSADINKESCTDGVYIKYAHVYNNFIVGNQGYILEKNIAFVKAIKKEESNKKAEELYAAMENQTQQSIDSVGKLCPFNGNAEFKNAAIELFKFYQEAWVDYKSLLNIKNKKERVQVLEDLKSRFNDKHSISEKKCEEKFIKAHSDFSNKYHLYVQSTSLHEELDSMLYLK